MSDTNCPQCNKLLTASTAADGSDRLPEPGDFTMCVYCGTILIFDDELRQRLPTSDELDDLSPEMLERMRRASYLFLNRTHHTS